MPHCTAEDGLAGLGIWQKILLAYARLNRSIPGKKSAYRKFCRRRKGSKYRIRTKHGFVFEGVIGDSVDNKIFVYREFEPGLTKLFLRIADKACSFVDLGCNIGYFSCLYGTLNRRGRILALDANQAVLERCKHNLEINSINADIVNIAVGDEKRKVSFNIPKNRHSLASLGDIGSRRNDVETIDIEMDALEAILDAHNFEQVDFMKIDIEGYEAKVFQSISPKVAKRIKSFVFEYSLDNLEQCGSSKEDLNYIEWLNQFELFRLDEQTGEIQPLDSIEYFPFREGTVFGQQKGLSIIP